MERNTEELKKSGIVIMGGGPAGITAGYELARNGFYSEIIEKFEQVGGLAKTLQVGDFRTDIGPHRFFSKNQYLYDLIEEVLEEHWILVQRLTRFYIQGKFFLYPVEMKDALMNLGLWKAFRAFVDYLGSTLRKKLLNPPVNNFEDYVILEFGRTLAELNMINYTEKIWGLPCSQISADWARQRIKGLSLMAIVKKALLKSQKGPKTLVDEFYYPKYGASQTYEKMSEILQSKGSTVRLNSRVVKIHHEDGQITAVTVKEGDKEEKVPAKELISSIPLTELVEILEPAVPDEVLTASKKLKWRFQVYLYLQLNKPSVSKDNWIYFPDREIPFGRMHEPKNFSKVMSPEDKTCLWVEHFVFPEDERWNCSADRLYEITMTDLERLGFVKKDEVEKYFKHREDYVYPIYDTEYEEHLEVVKDYLKTFKNLQLIGRGGRFRYNNQDHSIETGLLSARNIIENTDKYDLEKVGAEQEYFEKGYLKTEKGYFKQEEGEKPSKGE